MLILMGVISYTCCFVWVFFFFFDFFVHVNVPFVVKGCCLQCSRRYADVGDFTIKEVKFRSDLN